MKFDEIVAIGNDKLLKHIGSIYQKEENYKEAVKYYEAAYKLGNISAACKLGDIYDDGGNGIDKDGEKARNYYIAAKEKGHLAAVNALGNHYYDNGNYEEAFSYFKEGHKRGDRFATFNLGLSYCEGKGVPKNIHKALKYYIISYESGPTDVIDDIGKIDLVDIVDFIKCKLIHISELDSQITELKLRPPELGGPEYEAVKTHFDENKANL